MSTSVIYSLEIIIFPVSFMIILLGTNVFFGVWKLRVDRIHWMSEWEKKKQLNVINYEIIPWQWWCKKKQLHKLLFSFSFINSPSYFRKKEEGLKEWGWLVVMGFSEAQRWRLDAEMRLSFLPASSLQISMLIWWNGTQRLIWMLQFLW